MRPLVFFDLETTGVNISLDRIVEISLVKLCPDGHKESVTYRVNPEMHIPEGATAIHHITDEDVANCPTFRELAPKVLGYIRNCDLAGYNSNHFDVPMLQEELMRAGILSGLANDAFLSMICRALNGELYPCVVMAGGIYFYIALALILVFARLRPFSKYPR